MSPRGPRVVAELGRPETPEETAARKAEASQRYRSSQTFRHLIAALLVTLGVVLIVVLGVPRGTVSEGEGVDVTAEAAKLAEAYDRTVIAPVVPESWLVNAARMEGDEVSAWTVIYVPDDTSFIRVAQAFDPDPAWISRTLGGATPTGTVTVDGIVWDEYEIDNPDRAGNITYAMATDAGNDQVLVYGTADAATSAVVADALADQIRALREESE